MALVGIQTQHFLEAITMTELVQIAEGFPPHRQSLVEKMNCHLFYAESEIKGRQQPGGMDSARGTQIHRTMARYAWHCKQRGVSMDLDAFEKFRKGAGRAAAKILANLRDGYQVDFGHLVATECKMALDVNYRPTRVKLEFSEVESSGLHPHFEGTLDSIYAFRPEARILIDDYKSHPKPFDPSETIQSLEYAVFCFQHFAWVETITFRLVFVRYRNCTREVTYTRARLDTLIEALRASRDLQISIHNDYDEGVPLLATPGPHCQYCPKLTDRSCPISEFNAAMQLTIEDRLRFKIWYEQFAAANSKVLNAYVQASGRSVWIKDGNGRPVKYGPVDAIGTVYPVFLRDLDTGGLAYDEQGRPVLPIIDKLMDHAHANPDDTQFMLQLVISSSKLKSALNAQFRVHLDQAMKDDVFVISKPKMKVTNPKDVEEEEQDFDDEEEDD
jgi:hypothetical protein